MDEARPQAASGFVTDDEMHETHVIAYPAPIIRSRDVQDHPGCGYEHLVVD